MFCAYTRPRYQVSVNMTIDPLVLFGFTVRQDYFTHFEPSQSLLGEIGRYARKIAHSPASRALAVLTTHQRGSTIYVPRHDKI